MSSPKSMSQILAEGEALSVLAAERLWPEVVGPETARHSRPAAFSKGRLTVVTDSPAWSQELTYLEETIRARLEEVLPPGLVKEIRFKTASRAKVKPRRSEPAPARPQPAVRPMDARLRAELERELAPVADPELRELLLRLRLKARPD